MNAITTLHTRDAVEALADTLDAALSWLEAPCMLCRCRKASEISGDVDPDCAGLTRHADGCRTHSLVMARMVLTDAGIPTLPGRRQSLRRLVAAALADLSASPDFTDAALAALAESISTGPVQPEPHPGRSWAA